MNGAVTSDPYIALGKPDPSTFANPTQNEGAIGISASVTSPPEAKPHTV